LIGGPFGRTAITALIVTATTAAVELKVRMVCHNSTTYDEFGEAEPAA
jgi:hypothetical protein